MACAKCLCPVDGESARLMVCESPTKPGMWGAALCPACGHFTKKYDADGLEYAPAEDPRWVPLAKSPAGDLKRAKDAAGVREWIAAAVRVGRRWAKKKAQREQGYA